MVKKGTYMGKPLLTLLRAEDDRYGFAFGISKARLILTNLEDIKAFVEENKDANNGESNGNTTQPH